MQSATALTAIVAEKAVTRVELRTGLHSDDGVSERTVAITGHLLAPLTLLVLEIGQILAVLLGSHLLIVFYY